MAEVQYQGKSEPTVSVHGVPQSQYESDQGKYGAGSGGGEPGFKGWVKQHWPWLAGLAVVTILILWWVNRSSGASAANNQNTGTGMGTGNSSPDQLWGSQLDADYQQMTQQSTITNSLLQQLLNGMNNPSSNPPVTPPVVPPVTPPPTSPPPTPAPPPTSGGTLKPWWQGNPLQAGTQIKWGTQGQSFYQTPGSGTWWPLAGPQSKNDLLGNNGIFDYITSGQHGEWFVQQRQTVNGQQVFSPRRVLVAPHA